MAQLLSYHVRNWDKYYSTDGGLQCACKDESTDTSEKPQPQVVVDLCIPNCCEGCNNKLADAVTFMDGFERLEFHGKKLIVMGSLKAEDVLKVCKKVKKTVKLWPQETEATQARIPEKAEAEKSPDYDKRLAEHQSDACTIL